MEKNTTRLDQGGNIAINRSASDCHLWREACHYVSIAAELAFRWSICSSGERSAYYGKLRIRFEVVGEELNALRNGVNDVSPAQQTRFLNAVSAASDIIRIHNKVTEERLNRLKSRIKLAKNALN